MIQVTSSTWNMGLRLVIAVDIGFGLSLPLIPVFGLLPDIWFTRYQLIQAAFTILLKTLIGILVVSGIYIYLSFLCCNTLTGIVHATLTFARWRGDCYYVDNFQF